MRTRTSPTTARQARAGLRPGWRGDRRAHPLLPPRPQVTTARLAATGAFRRAVAGCGPRVTHPPTYPRRRHGSRTGLAPAVPRLPRPRGDRPVPRAVAGDCG